jgi:translocation-and-assembly-module (TAM) inner membrane subunit TamB-like protein
MSPKRKRFRWLRYLFGGLTVAVLLLIVFYQPILFGLTEFVAQQVARSQKFTIRFKIHGSIFSNLLIQDLHLEPLPSNQTLPIERLDIRRFTARYSLLSLLQQKPSEVVRLIELQDVNLVIRPTPPSSTPPAQPTQAGPLRVLPIIPQRIDVSNINVRVRRAQGDLVVENFGINLTANRPGSLTCSEFALPPMAPWKDLKAGLAIQEDVLHLTGLSLLPFIAIDQLTVDASHLSAGRLVASVSGKTFDAPLRIDTSLSSQATQNLLVATAQVARLDLHSFEQFTNIPFTGSIPMLDISLNGDLNHPRSLNGRAILIGEKIRYQEKQIDDLDLRVNVTEGKGTVERCLVNAGLNRVSVSGNFLLPTHANAFIDEFVAHVGIAGALLEPARFVPALHSQSLIWGNSQIQGGNASTTIHLFNAGLKQANLQVPRINATICAVARLPLPQDLWSGCAAVVDAGVNDTKIDAAMIDRVGAIIRLQDAKSNADVELSSGKSNARLRAELPMPAPGATPDLKQVDAMLKFHLDSIADFLRESPVQGSLVGDGEMALRNGQPVGEIQFNGDNLRYGDFAIQRITMNANAADGSAKIQQLHAAIDDSNYLDASGEIKLVDPFPYEGKAVVRLIDLSKLESLLTKLGQPAGLRGTFEMTARASGDIRQGIPRTEIQANGHDIDYRGLPVQNLDLKAKTESEKATIESVHVNFDQRNSVDLGGTLSLNAPLHYDASGQIQLDDLRVFDAFLKSIGPEASIKGRLSARFSGDGEVKDNRIANAELSISGTQINYRGLSLQSTEVSGSIKDNFLTMSTAKVIADRNNSISLSGRGQLSEPYEYEGDANVDLKDLRFLDPLLKSFGQDVGLGGKLNLTWSGKGQLKSSAGNAQLHIADLEVKGTKGIKADVEGSYEGLKAEVTRLQVISPLGNLDTTVRLSSEFLDVPHLEVRRDQNLMTGSANIPLDFNQKKIPIAMDRPLSIDLVADKVSLAGFQARNPQITGNVGLIVKASGTLRDPSIQIKTSVTDLRSPTVSSLAAGSGDFSVDLASKVLTLAGHFQQPEIQPLQMQGKIPVDVAQVLDSGKLPPDTPIALSVHWPETNLQFARRLTPLIRILEGRIAIDANVAGTLEKPAVTGAVSANVSRFRASTDVVPPISDFAVNINFRDNHRITFDRFNGLAGGGPFSLTGSIDLAQGTNPQFDLALTTRKFLLTRTDNVIVRSNIDLTLRGPLSGLEIAGKVGLVDSRFFQDIDILPLNLPGRPAPQPPSVPPPSSISITTPPVRDWKFNVKVQTDGPFLIQSNLARGQVTVDLQVGGTGLQPTVTGFVRVDQLTASLPFSHMDITNGYIDFSPGGNPLNPSFNITGVSLIRDYEVHMRVFGDVSNFQILFDSSPPLAQGDIATLLATGSTTSEFVQDPALLAGRASFILAQQLLTKVFKIRPNAQQQSFLERLQVDIIPGDRPGTQDISARFSLTNNWQLIGDFGQSGVSGRLRYLIRFR